MTVSLFDHPVYSALLGDDEIAVQFSFDADLAAMLRFELALAGAQARCALIPQEAAASIETACAAFKPDIAGLRAGALRDGMVVPALVSQLRKAVGEASAKYVHFGSTSQDVIDTSLVLRLKPVLPILRLRLAQAVRMIGDLESRFGDNSLMGRTRMQRALAIRAGDRLATWRAPLERHVVRLDALAPGLLSLQLGGPVGTLDKMNGKGALVAQELGRLLELNVPERCWHTQRDAIAEFAGLLSLVTGSLGKIGQDVALMAQNGIDDVGIVGGGGSSAMPHKENPVSAEILVTLARFNAAQLAAMHATLVHEQERSGSAWTLEWIVLPQMVMATAAALRLSLSMLANITRLGSA